MQEISVEGKVINITHGDKILFPLDNITKLDLVNYYIEISDYILPFVRDRPLTIYCLSDRVNEKGFIRQHAPKGLPDWFKTFELKKIAGGTVNHILCNDKASLLYLVNSHMITIYRWLSTIKNPNNPDLGSIEIHSTSKTRSFISVIKAAQTIKKELEDLGYKPYLMTNGLGGLYVISKIYNQSSFDEIRNIMRQITLILTNKYPKEFSIDIHKKYRKELVYLDVMHNSYGQSLVVPFSVLPENGCPIVVPLKWEEIESNDFIEKKFNINNIMNRINTIGINWHSYET